MKNILILVYCCLMYSAGAQTERNVKSMNIPANFIYSDSVNTVTICTMDTVDVIMLCEDTSHWFTEEFIPNKEQDSTSYVRTGHIDRIDSGPGYYFSHIYGEAGKEVRQLIMDGGSRFFQHKNYLQKNNTPLSKNIIVWMSKPLK